MNTVDQHLSRCVELAEEALNAGDAQKNRDVHIRRALPNVFGRTRLGGAR